ncbi:ABC transporter permease [Levilactobacillus namurensis]|uniref:ABC transporter permease n=1 Tax=Levilactobacillus namurensis TaxID=380393 RepID=UPI000464F942|nr:ABC transporter permease [Levilactobacillus namurensis]
MTKHLLALFWQRYRQRFWALLAISLVMGLILALLNVTTWNLSATDTLFGNQIHRWEPYLGSANATFSLYSYWLVFVFWLGGLFLMLLDCTENFNQFLFASGYRRSVIYWTKLGMSLVGLVAVAVITTLEQYLIYWLHVPHGVTLNLAWPGVLTSWALGLAMSLGMFALSWFAALIVGQTGPLMVTIGGFTISLIGVANIIQGLLLHWTNAQRDWLAVGLWLAASLILWVWGAGLFGRLSLEHNGEYLLFPKLRLPLYLVFVVYMTALFTINGTDLMAGVWTFVLTGLFGYGWLWRPHWLEDWRQRHA